MLQPYTYCSFTEHICIISALVPLQYTWQSIPALFDTLAFRVAYPPLPLACLPTLLFYRMEWDTPDRLHTGHSCCQGGPPPSQTGPFTWNPLWFEIWIKVKLFDTFAIRLAQCPPSALPLIRWSTRNGIHWIDLICATVWVVLYLLVHCLAPFGPLLGKQNVLI